MANQRFIMEKEEKILDAAGAADMTREAWELEIQTEDTGHPNPANRDCWGTLYVNTWALRNRLNKLLAAMDAEFGTDKDFGKQKYGKSA